MSTVPIFDHIQKTAGSTVRRVMYRVYGKGVALIVTIGEYPQTFAQLHERLDGTGPPVTAIVSHAGAGLHLRLPSQHTYPRFTMLRDPVARTVSAYFHMKRHRKNFAPGSIMEWLESDPWAFNHQTSFLGGLRVREMLDDVKFDVSQFDDALLARAVAQLDEYETVGIVEQFDASLLTIGHALGWPTRKLLYEVANVGNTATPLTAEELTAVRAANEMDQALYEHGQGILARDFAALGASERRLTAFRAASRAYGTAFPVLHPPARAVLHATRRVRENRH